MEHVDATVQVSARTCFHQELILRTDHVSYCGCVFVVFLLLQPLLPLVLMSSSRAESDESLVQLNVGTLNNLL